MTTPARTLNNSTLLTGNYRYRGDWYPPGYWNPGSYMTTIQEIDIRPESISNPLRPDGTRAPSGFSHNWAHTTLPFRRPTWRQVSGGSVTTYEAVGPVPMAGSNYNVTSIASAANARWAATGTNTDFPATVENMARTNFLNKVAGSKASLGSALTEFKGACETVAHAAESITHIVKGIANRVRTNPADVASVLRGDFNAFRPSQQLGDDITSLWLAKQYGIRPLLQDIDGAGQALNEAVFDRGQSFLLLVRSGAVITKVEETRIPADAGQTFWDLRLPLRVSTGVHFSGVYEIPKASARQYQQIGLGNIPAAWWEAVRWSWLVDHVFNSGKWLNSLMAVDGLRWKEGSRSRIQRVKSLSGRDATFSPSGSTWKLDTGFDPLHVELEIGRFSRDVLANGVFPAFMPSVKPRLGLEFMSNALSVLSTIASARSGPRLF